MATALRAIGPFNGTMPVATGQMVGFIRDPSQYAYLRYTQMVPAPEIQFMWARVDPDDAVRLTSTDAFGWAYDDYRPTGKGFQPRVEWVEARTQRWDFPYTIGEATLRVWRQNGVDPRMIFDRMRANHAALHRATRAVETLNSGLTGANTASLNTLLGTSGAGIDKSSGEQYLVDGTENPNFQLLKKMANRVKRRIHLATNGAIGRKDLVMVMPPVVAQAWSESGECFEALKQSRYAKELTDLPNPNQDWNIPDRYAGFELVVEDTPRVFVRQSSNGTTVADVTVPSEKDYVLNTDTIHVTSRPGGLDGGYGMVNFSTLQLYTFGGAARVEAFSEPKHELVEGHVVLEDKFVLAAAASGFKITDVLTT